MFVCRDDFQSVQKLQTKHVDLRVDATYKLQKLGPQVMLDHSSQNKAHFKHTNTLQFSTNFHISTSSVF